MKRLLSLFIIISLFFSHVHSSDQSQWRGPNRNGSYPEKNLLKKWPETGPQLLWLVEDLGQGYSSAAVAKGRVYVTEMVEGEGSLRAYDISGKLLWKKVYGKEWEKSHSGARTTPTVFEGRIYLMSAYGEVFCFDAISGNVLWSVDLQKQFDAQNIEWGMTESLLVDGEKVICTPGGPQVTIAALNRFTGKTIWTSKTNGQTSGYCSPILIEYGNMRLIATMIQKSIIAVNAADGKFLWQYPHATDYDINANSPIYQDGFIYCLSGYGSGGEKLKMAADGKSVQKVWQNETLDSQIGAAVLVDGFLYGSGHKNRGWRCLDWNTGEEKFATRALGGKGNIIYADGMLYIYSEAGDVALVKPNPNAFEVVSSFKVVKGSDPHWAHLVIDEGRLYVRHGNALLVYSIAK